MYLLKLSLTFFNPLTLVTNGTTSTDLSERDIAELLNLLQIYSSKWCDIGLSLGFLSPELDTISSMSKLFSGAPTSYLQEILSQWIQWPTVNHPTRPTLETLLSLIHI